MTYVLPCSMTAFPWTANYPRLFIITSMFEGFKFDNHYDFTANGCDSYWLFFCSLGKNCFAMYPGGVTISHLWKVLILVHTYIVSKIAYFLCRVCSQEFILVLLFYFYFFIPNAVWFLFVHEVLLNGLMFLWLLWQERHWFFSLTKFNKIHQLL